MIIAIIAGGSGTRLWPLSTHDKPKHLLSLTTETSLLQNTYSRAKLLTDNIYVVPEASHADQVAKQLPELEAHKIIVEPARRGTASCIMLALAHIGQYHAADEPVVFMHADYQITDNQLFAKTVEVAAKSCVREQAITLIGLKPTYPATGFGYIETADRLPDVDNRELYRVSTFKEKPDLATAKSYIKSGNYLWNLGLFAAPTAVFERETELNNKALYENYQQLKQNIKQPQDITPIYLKMESQPIEPALIEKSKNIIVVPGEFDWLDIGSFFDLHKVLKQADGNTQKGNVTLVECEDVMVHGGDKPVIAIGLSGVVVVDTPDGLLVCAKEKSQLVGDVVKQLGLTKPVDK